MSAPLRIEITEQAQTQISVASAWWADNRPAAPSAIHDELDRLLGLIRAQPEIGTIARHSTLPGVRRVTLSRIRYHLYYRVAVDAIQVLAFWHTSRGNGPPV